MGERTEYVYEQLLVLRCQTGSESAFAELVERYGPRLRVYLRRLLDRPEDAEDALQEVWTDVYRSIGRLESSGSFAPWIYRIARDRAYRQLRRKKLKVVPLEGAEEVPEGGQEEQLEVDDLKQLYAAMDRLSVEHREVLLLRFVEGMSPEQIGQVTACPAGTVRSRLYYAKRQLRRELETDHERTRTGQGHGGTESRE